MNSREAFERVFSNSCVDLSKDETGEYSSQPTRMCYSFFVVGWQEQQKRIDELTVGCGLQRDHIKGLEAELKKAWTTVDQEGHKKHGLVMLLKFIKEHFEMNDLDKAMPRVYEELEQALKGGDV
ncbi:hypothetical protein [Acinetobacter ursingii]|uniref:hypothetical protein n=1 Tax=Acinetobacter ursingii TaxID=108980 RepID=UPI00029AB998|nr:hypothetical protein [Acinetobacter ursingii]ENV76216.1 hypothetical protein F944_01687 [Acinetobacter ursingii DSM 16037 = CIP 107286]QQT67276.1 hypothetical protein I6I52_06500 [Acinetobacter ursingii]